MLQIRRILAFFILSKVKIFSTIFYRGQWTWLEGESERPWKDIRLMVFLNHTSLYEPLFLQILPFRELWYLSGHFNIPGADITLKRPIVGRFWKLMIPNISSVTRKLDGSWNSYLSTIKKSDVVMIAAEGRMKRPNGLDKFGKPMTVRAGVADIIEKLDDGQMLLCFSGGLHHVQAPGQFFPRLFKPISMNFRKISIKEYKERFSPHPRERKIQIIQDLQRMLETDCP
jgi:hypothetical protein